MKTTLWLDCSLTGLEIEEKKEELTEATLAKVKAEEALIGETATWKERKRVLESAISSEEEQCRKLANAISTEHEMRHVDCETEIHPPNHLTIRTDTGEVVRSRAPTSEELQMALDMGNDKVN